MRLEDFLLIAGTAAAVFFIMRAARSASSSGPLQGYFQYANSAPPGFVYDPVIDAWSRTLDDGTKQIYV